MNMTRNRIRIALAIVLFAAILTGCAKREEIKNLPPLDQKIGAEKCAVLIIPFNAKVKRIDGAKRGLFSSWGTGWSMKSKAATLLVPAGEHTMIFEYSHPQAGWSAKGLEYTAMMGVGKTYMVSVTLDEKTEGSIVFSAINIATSFVRDQIIDLIPFIEWLPCPIPEGVVYQISEITDQTALDQYLLEENSYREKNMGIIVGGVVIGILWFFILFVLRILGYFLFMAKLKNNAIAFQVIFCIGLVAVGIVILNYNSTGFLSLYLLSTLLIGIGLSGWDLGIQSNNSGVEKLNKADYAGSLSDFNEAIKSAPLTALYYYNRALAYFGLQDRGKAIADLTEAVRLAPNNARFKKALTDAGAQAANGMLNR